jgi:hypothetical protein
MSATWFGDSSCIHPSMPMLLQLETTTTARMMLDAPSSRMEGSLAAQPRRCNDAVRLAAALTDCHYTSRVLHPNQNICTYWLLRFTFDHSSYSKKLWKCYLQITKIPVPKYFISPLQCQNANRANNCNFTLNGKRYKYNDQHFNEQLLIRYRLLAQRAHITLINLPMSNLLGQS